MGTPIPAYLAILLRATRSHACILHTEFLAAASEKWLWGCGVREALRNLVAAVVVHVAILVDVTFGFALGVAPGARGARAHGRVLVLPGGNRALEALGKISAALVVALAGRVNCGKFSARSEVRELCRRRREANSAQGQFCRSTGEEGAGICTRFLDPCCRKRNRRTEGVGAKFTHRRSSSGTCDTPWGKQSWLSVVDLSWRRAVRRSPPTRRPGTWGRTGRTRRLGRCRSSSCTRGIESSLPDFPSDGSSLGRWHVSRLGPQPSRR